MNEDDDTRTDDDPATDDRRGEMPEPDPRVSTIPLDTEDGGTVVIEQENMGGERQVGGGEYKNAERGRTPDEAAAEQDELAAEAPVPGVDEERPSR